MIPDRNRYLVGETFVYICNGDLVLDEVTSQRLIENECIDVGDGTSYWILSNVLSNLPQCCKSKKSFLKKKIIQNVFAVVQLYRLFLLSSVHAEI